MSGRQPARSPLALAVLALLGEAPMHPYRMQHTLKKRGKDRVVNVRDRASIYHVIARLERAGLVRAVETAQSENRPERTVYALTDDGINTCRRWVAEMLATPADEFPELPAALAFLPVLTPDDAVRQLQARAASLESRISRARAELHSYGSAIPRLFLLEEEYRTAALQTELDWVRSLVDDLHAGRLTWTKEWLMQVASPSPTDDLPES